MKIVRYHPDYKERWDSFIKKSINGCFLHERDFMEYHSDRFDDHSLLFFDGEEMAACFPAHITGKTLHSHRGLTFGGLIVKAIDENASAKAESHPALLQNLLDYCKTQKINRLEFKLPPKFYDADFEQHHESLRTAGFKETVESTDLVVNLNKKWSPSPKKTAGYRNGKFAGLKVVVSEDFQEFWNKLLDPQLSQRHNARPVHSLEEIQLLQGLFPKKILQYDVESNGGKIAGITLFDFGTILKVQYAAGSEMGFKKNAMDFLYLEIIREAGESGREFVDLGTVNNPDGSINEGLLRFKKQLGAVVTPVVELALDLRS